MCKVVLTITVTYKITDYTTTKRRGDKSLDRWLGYTDLFNSSVDNKTIVNL